MEGNKMYSNIVVGTDGSEPAWKAVSHAADLAKLCGATLHVVQGVPRPMVMDGGFAGAPVALPSMAEAVDACRAHLVGQCDAIDHDAVEVHVVEGSGADTVIDTASTVQADLVVVGSRGMSGAKRFVLGSVPNAVSHHAQCSVLIVKTS
jgi:nucleotide-binding universal stress UspA family protein